MDRDDPFVFEESTLSCRGRAVWRHDPAATSIYLGIIIQAGSLDDPVGRKGLAHLCEHLAFAGTERYPDQRTLTGRVEDEGGELGAWTGTNNTWFTVAMPAAEAVLAWRIIDQMVFHPLLRPSDVAKQRNDVKTEIAAGHGHWPPPDAARLIKSRLFGRAATSRAGISGGHRSLAAIDLASVRAFRQDFYFPGNAIFLATGNLSFFPRPWPEWVEFQVGGWPIRQPPSRASVPLRRTSRPEWLEGGYPGLPHPRLSLAVRLHEYDRWPKERWHELDRLVELIDFMLASKGMSAILSDLLRSEYELEYSLETSFRSFVSPGHYWLLSSEVKNRTDVPIFFRLIRQALTDPRTFSPEQVERAKQAKLKRLMRMDLTSEDALIWAIDHLNEGQPIISRSEQLDGFRRLAAADIQALIASDFAPERWIAIVYNPI